MKAHLNGAFPKRRCGRHILHRTAKGWCSRAVMGPTSGIQLPGSIVGRLATKYMILLSPICRHVKKEGCTAVWGLIAHDPVG